MTGSESKEEVPMEHEIAGAAFNVLASVVDTPHDCESFLRSGGLDLAVSVATACRAGGFSEGLGADDTDERAPPRGIAEDEGRRW